MAEETPTPIEPEPPPLDSETDASESGDSGKAPEIVTGLSLKQLDALCRAPITVRIPMLSAGKIVELTARRLTPAEAFQVNLEMRRALPKLVAGDRPGQERFDLSDPEYIRRREDAVHRARAMALYLAVPIFSEAKPGMTKVEAMRDFIEDQLTEEILNALFAAIVPASGAEDANAWAGFF